MRRYWVPKDSIQGDEVRLRDEVLHHVRDVCRQRVGSKFEVIIDASAASQGKTNGAGHAANPPAVEAGVAHLVEIIAESKHESLAQILETRVIPPLPEPHIHLALSIPRFPVFEAVVEKAVELGVKSIHPFFSEFSFIRTQSDTWDKKLPRFMKIVQGATQQSGRGDLMEIKPAVDLKSLVAESGGAFNRSNEVQGLFAYEGEAVLSAKEALSDMKSGWQSDSSSHGRVREIWAFIGSEGGFSEREVELFQSLGLKPVTLGAQVLRVETACVATISIIKYDFDLMR